MAPLQACGCRFALDDFGAGFTSIAYVAQLPVAHLKLDRALIAPLG
jgi:EAL domain-containing protein (putative c-di-GMP-specific phosphodiesterase class I)